MTNENLPTNCSLKSDITTIAAFFGFMC